jgi:hypothetical protein
MVASSDSVDLSPMEWRYPKSFLGKEGGLVRHGRVSCGVERLGTVGSGAVLCGSVGHGMAGSGSVRCGLVRSRWGVIWIGSVRHGSVSFGKGSKAGRGVNPSLFLCLRGSGEAHRLPLLTEESAM